MLVMGQPTWAIFDINLHWRVTVLLTSLQVTVHKTLLTSAVYIVLYNLADECTQSHTSHNMADR